MTRFTPLAAIAVLSLLSACAAPDDAAYPSLAVRPIERTANVPPAPPAQPTPEPVSATLEQAIAGLGADADRGEAAFRAALPETQRLVAAGRGAATGTENWAIAQRALSRLIAARAPTTLALADIDRLTTQQMDGGHVAAADALAVQQARVAALAGGQQADIDRLMALVN